MQTSNAAVDDVISTAASNRKQSSRSKRSSSEQNGNNSRSKGKNNRQPMALSGDVTSSAESETAQLTMTSPLAITSGSIMTVPVVGSVMVAEPMSLSPTGSTTEKSGISVDIASLMTPTALVIDVVCGLNRARLYVDGLRNGSKTPCILMEASPGDENGGKPK